MEPRLPSGSPLSVRAAADDAERLALARFSARRALSQAVSAAARRADADARLIAALRASQSGQSALIFLVLLPGFLAFAFAIIAALRTLQ